MRKLFCLSIVSLVCGLFAACGPSAGTEGGACYPNDTCNDGLLCLSNLCVQPPGMDAGTPDAGMPTPDAPPAVPPEGVDILFVIDNSGSMNEEQQSLAVNLNRFITALGGTDGVLPDVHLGIVSADIGVGPNNGGTGCSVEGDDGDLLSNPACGLTERYIIDIDDGAGGRIRNYTGDLSDTFACSALLGINGCGFEQPLASMRRALDGSNIGNTGFLRPEAMLAVVILTDEDDCSVSDTTMYDASQNDPNGPLGALSSFRCFEFGVQCEPDDPRTPGPRQNCVPRANSPYMPDVQEYVDFLRGLKPGGEVVVVTIQGNPTPVTVGIDPENNIPRLAPSCVSASGEAVPGVRLQTFRDGFPGRNLTTSICDENYGPIMEELGEMIDQLLP